MHYVYYLLDPVTRDLLYIGRSINPKSRLYSFNKLYGLRAVLSDFLQRHISFEAAQAAELKAIAKHWPPYNKSLQSGIGALGRTRKEITKLRISASNKGRVGVKGFLGKHHTQESKALLSATLLGKAATLGMTGKKHTPETKAKMSGKRGPLKKPRKPRRYSKPPTPTYR